MAGNGILDVLLPFGGLKSPTWSSRGDLIMKPGEGAGVEKDALLSSF